MQQIDLHPLTAAAFLPFGQVIQTEGADHYAINAGMTERYHDLAAVELTGANPRPLISIFRGQPYQLPLPLKMMERHPLGSQAFYPLSAIPFVVVVAPDNNGQPGRPLAFITAPGQGINIAQNVWHGVLTPLQQTCDFVVIDRGGDGNNLEEHHFSTPYLIAATT
ncbi:ureidoglycolate lyase [Devosia rhodophyticola]|uniref:Ureidoglycolate lyase n=1 Tax=Devosia rhodophyticola TaxID=3026423 RepID=A0ABY7YUJ6_9HYPH|nr:ureidoglycolate lyase [Devosia rhodophyticola]WDR05030.1 ureidoglycolate lyase [Devosia rhodophyticola]